MKEPNPRPLGAELVMNWDDHPDLGEDGNFVHPEDEDAQAEEFFHNAIYPSVLRALIEAEKSLRWPRRL